MGTMAKSTWMKKAAALAIAPAAILSVTACSDSAGSEQGADVEDIVEEPGSEAEEEFVSPEAVDDAYIGDYDQPFYDDNESYVGETVTLSAAVNDLIAPTAFTIAGTDATTVDELLVVHPENLPDVSPEMSVSVTGTVMENFELVAVEQDLGLDLEDELYDEWDGKPYLHATNIDDSATTGP